MVEQRLHQRCLARSRSAADEAGLTLADEADNRVPNRRRQTARLDQFIGAEPAVEFPNGEGRAADRRGSANDGDTGAVRQPGIENGILARQVLPQDARYTLNGRLQAFIAVRRCQSDLLDAAAAVRVNTARA